MEGRSEAWIREESVGDSRLCLGTGSVSSQRRRAEGFRRRQRFGLEMGTVRAWTGTVLTFPGFIRLPPANGAYRTSTLSSARSVYCRWLRDWRGPYTAQATLRPPHSM